MLLRVAFYEGSESTPKLPNAAESGAEKSLVLSREELGSELKDWGHC